MLILANSFRELSHDDLSLGLSEVELLSVKNL